MTPQSAARHEMQALALLAADRHQHSVDLAAVCYVLGRVRLSLADYPGAVAALECALSAHDPGFPTEQLCQTLTLLGTAHRLQGRYTLAESQLRRAAERAGRLEKGTQLLAEAHNALGVVCKDTGRYREADDLYRRASAENSDPNVHATLLHNRAGLACAQGNLASAEQFARAAVASRIEVCGHHDPAVAADLGVLGSILYRRSVFRAAERVLIRSSAIFGDTLGRDHYEVASNLVTLAVVRADTGRVAEAEANLRHALDIKTRLLGSNHPDVARLLNNFAVLCQRQGRTQEARICQRHALRTFVATLGASHPDTVACHRNGKRMDEESTDR